MKLSKSIFKIYIRSKKDLGHPFEATSFKFDDFFFVHAQLPKRRQEKVVPFNPYMTSFLDDVFGRRFCWVMILRNFEIRA